MTVKLLIGRVIRNLEALAGRDVIQCNYAVGTKIFAPGAKCFLVNPNAGWGGETSIEIVGWSRGNRWVHKWERTWRIHNFRLRTIPPENPLFKRFEFVTYPFDLEDWVERLNKVSNEQRERRGIAIESRKPELHER